MRRGRRPLPPGFGVIWTTVTFVANRSLTFVSVLVLARLLTPGDFGVVAAILVFLSVLELVGDLGMKQTVVYEQEEGISERVQTAFTINAVIAFALTGVAIAAAEPIAALFGMAEEAHLFRLASLYLALTGLGNVHDSLLMRELAFKRRLAPQVGRALARGGLSIGLALAGLGAAALVWGMLAGAAAWTAIQWALTPLRPRLRFDRATARSMAGYASGAAALQIVAAVGTRIDSVAIGRVLGASALGLYTIAFRVPELVIESVAWNVSQVAFPALSKKRVTDRAGVARATLKLFHYQALYAVPVATGLALLAPPLVVVLFSDTWREAGGVMSAVAVMTGISSLVFPLGDVFKALARQRLYVVLMLVQFPVFAGTIILAAPHGILWVAWARVAVDALHAAVVGAVTLRILGVRLGALGRSAAPALAAGAGVALGAGTVRLLWPALEAGPVVAGTLAGIAGGAAAVRLLAPATWRDLRAQLAERPRRGRAVVQAPG